MPTPLEVHLYAAPAGATLEYTGMKIFKETKIEMNTGWNLVSYPPSEDRERALALNNLTLGTEVDAIWTFDAKAQVWVEIGEADQFEVGRGYWIHARTGCTWEVAA